MQSHMNKKISSKLTLFHIYSLNEIIVIYCKDMEKLKKIFLKLVNNIIAYLMHISYFI